MKLYDINQALAAIAIVIFVLLGLKSFAGAMFPDRPEPMSAYMAEILKDAEPSEPKISDNGQVQNEAEIGAVSDAEPSTPSLFSMIATADPAAGASQVGICKACHTFEKGGRALMGPNLWGIVGRSKAGVSDFAYSPALSDLGGEWTYEDLDKFLESPSAFAKGTKMSFAGAKKPEQRRAIIAYLRLQADNPAPIPTE